MDKKIPEHFSFESNTTINLPSDELLENQYRVAKKKHRNAIETYNHYFLLLTHPLSLVIILSILFILYFIIKYITIQTTIPWLIAFRDDLRVGISYIFTITVTYIISSFLENYKKLQT